MISRQEVEQLAERPVKDGSPILSVYLNIDQSRHENLNRQYESKLKGMLRSIEHQLQDKKQLQEFSADAGRALAFVHDYQPKRLGLIIFCDDSEGLFWWRDLRTQVPDDSRWSASPYLLPLAEALDEFERYGVILADRAHARLFTVFLGEIEEHLDVLAPKNVERRRTAGTDQIWSQSRFRRKADQHAHEYLKQAADTMSRLADKYLFDRLVLAGIEEAIAQLRSLLPKRLRSRIVGHVPISAGASEEEVLQATLQLELQVERDQESRIVRDLIAVSAKGEQAVVGVEPVLDELQRKRLWRLVYAEGTHPPGWKCLNCSSLFAREPERCDYCSREVASAGDLIEQVVTRVIAEGGEVEQVRGVAADLLKDKGGVGGYLRY